jgi:hypothetical protein
MFSRAPSVEAQPEVELSNWSIIKVWFKNGKQEHVFIGNRGEGFRISTNIVQYEKADRQGKTTSGRVYKLIDQPVEMNEQNELWPYWESWLQMYAADDWEDVSLNLLSTKVVVQEKRDAS